MEVCICRTFHLFSLTKFLKYINGYSQNYSEDCTRKYIKYWYTHKKHVKEVASILWDDATVRLRGERCATSSLHKRDNDEDLDNEVTSSPPCSNIISVVTTIITTFWKNKLLIWQRQSKGLWNILKNKTLRLKIDA